MSSEAAREVARGILGETAVLERIVGWAKGLPTIRAVMMSSSRTRPDGPVDILSDYDIILAVTNSEEFGSDDAWQATYGPPMVRWGDQDEMYGLTTYFRGVVYQDYVKIDWTIWPDTLLERIAEQITLPDELDAGYRVLLDKDGRTVGWKTPTYKAFIPIRPTEAEYRAVVEEYWWGATYAAKSLWRDEIVFTKWILDQDMKTVAMRRMLEWRFEIDHDWSVRPGVLGRGLKRYLPADIFEELVSTYVGPGIEDTWEALFRLNVLFRRVSIEVGAALGYVYPQEVDDQVTAFLEMVRELPPGIPSS
jgi:aminoglycoside 6-adenylyltransferase